MYGAAAHIPTVKASPATMTAYQMLSAAFQ
jgi:hypothetical protein